MDKTITTTMSKENQVKIDEARLKQINAILEQFNFKNVHAYMVWKDWKWMDDDGFLTVPTPYRLRTKAFELLKEVSNVGSGDVRSCRTGGFIATAYKKGPLVLEFPVESVNSNDIPPHQ
jgi:hypothetical protein